MRDYVGPRERTPGIRLQPSQLISTINHRLSNLFNIAANYSSTPPAFSALQRSSPILSIIHCCHLPSYFNQSPPPAIPLLPPCNQLRSPEVIHHWRFLACATGTYSLWTIDSENKIKSQLISGIIQEETRRLLLNLPTAFYCLRDLPSKVRLISWSKPQVIIIGIDPNEPELPILIGPIPAQCPLIKVNSEARSETLFQFYIWRNTFPVVV